MKGLLFLFTLSILAICTACEDSNDYNNNINNENGRNPPVTKKTFYPSVINISGIETQLVYHDDNRISKITTNDGTINELTYSLDKKLLQQDIYRNGERQYFIWYTYDKNKITEHKKGYWVSEVNPVLYPDIVYTLNNHNQIISSVTENIITNYHYDNSGNLMEVIYQNGDTISYKYDDKKNIFSNVKVSLLLFSPFSSTFINNLIEEKHTNNSGELIISYTYEYNKDGYPTQQTKYEGNKVTISRISYQLR